MGTISNINDGHYFAGTSGDNIKGKVVEEFGVFTVEVDYCKKVGIKDQGRRGMSW